MPKSREAFGQTGAPGEIERPRAATRMPPVERPPGFDQSAAPRAPLARPPRVTPRQLMRLAILLLGAAIYADRANLTTGSRFPSDRWKAAVEAAPTASFGSAARVEPGSGR